MHAWGRSSPNKDFEYTTIFFVISYSGSRSWSRDSSYLWNHGTISPDILDIWAGVVGPGVKEKQTSTQGNTLDIEIRDWTVKRDAIAKSLQQNILQTIQGYPVSPEQLSHATANAQALLDKVQSATQN